ncbi:MBL fold metallo-hydrolase [Nakamurella endophytica]|uniref:MBL fold metallo-hydrolase n=1 Tax=Nakamurella endophytica TaxID=1748367 RepID=A0A917SS31_9ACTN|nr:MBL fold metallo-hydrolase [Nakamurella endophytica]GGL94050.1 MBL fold metallo-hydrolase [Nakamurella endophytica]
MLIQVADGVLVHRSAFCQSNAVVLHGADGDLVVDPGITAGELACLADDLDRAGRTVVAGFATHPHWDHLLWDARLGEVPRYCTAGCAATVRDRLSDPGAPARVATMLPPEFADQIPLDLLGRVTGLPREASRIPWNGPDVRILEHHAHALGHAALWIPDRGVLIAGDMLSDVLLPILDLNRPADPVEEYLAALALFESLAGDVDVLVPGHGSVGSGGSVQARVDLDRAYLRALPDGGGDDPRISSAFGAGFLPALHEGQAERLAARRVQEAAPAH